jgi:hypothetical protein
MIKNLPVSRGIETHPYLVDDLAELPTSLHIAAQQALEPGEQPLRIVVVPAQSFFKNWFGRRYVPPQALLFTAQGLLHVQEAVTPDKPAQITYLKAADLLFVQLRLLLLYGRLEVAGQVSGALAKVMVEFNTVGVHLLLPGLRQLLSLAWGQTELTIPAERQTDRQLPEFENLPLKFKNGLRIYGLQPGECLLEVLFQPGLWRQYGPVWQRQISANTLLALTDHEVIIVEEERTGHKNAYGWIVTFCPLACLKEFETTPGVEQQALQLHLTRNGVAVDRQVTLASETALAWQNLWARYHVNPN